MKILCKMLGGSHSYGLATATSDLDYRGVYLDENIRSVIGLEKNEQQQVQNTEKDELYSEFRHTLRLLRQANTQTIEMLYNDTWLEISPLWKQVQFYKYQLVDSEKLFNCLRGYMQGELRMANGERTGKLGGKRKEAIDKYGYSPKNFLQLFRLAWAGSVYFLNGYFPVNVSKENPEWAKTLLDIKMNPHSHTKENLNETAKTMEYCLVKSFENRKITTKFNEDIANELCLIAYKDILQREFKTL